MFGYSILSIVAAERASILRFLQAVSLAVLLGGAVWLWTQHVQQQPGIASSSDKAQQELLQALDREAANSTARYWFGQEDSSSQQGPSSNTPAGEHR